MIKEIYKKLFTSKDEVTVPKEYLEALESLYGTCIPLMFRSRLTEEIKEEQREIIKRMTFNCYSEINQLREQDLLSKDILEKFAKLRIAANSL